MKSLDKTLLILFFISLIICQEKKENTKKSDENLEFENINLKDYKRQQVFDEKNLPPSFKNYHWEIDTKLYFNISSEEALILNDENYEKEINSNKIIYVLFYNRTVFQCNKIKNQLLKALKKIDKYGLNFTFGALDVYLNKITRKKMNIQTIPKLILYINGKKFDVLGERTADSYIKYIKLKTNQLFREVYTLKEIREIRKNFDYMVVNTLKSDTLGFKNLKEFAENHDEIEFLTCTTEECIKKLGNDFLLYNKNEKGVYHYYDFKKEEPFNASINDINSFINIFNFEYGGFITGVALNQIFDKNKDSIIYFRDNKTENNLDKEFKELSTKYQEQFYFFKSDIKGTEEFEDIGELLEIDENDMPGIYLFTNLTNSNLVKKYKYPYESLNEKNFDEFLNNFKEQKLKPELKSNLIYKKSQQIFNYKRIVGRNFNKEVLEEKNHNILLGVTFGDYGVNLYLEEMLERMATKYKKKKEYRDLNVVYKMIDIKENDIPSLKQFNNAQILFYRKLNKKFITFTQEWKEVLIDKWIKDIIDGKIDENTVINTKKDEKKDEKKDKKDEKKEEKKDEKKEDKQFDNIDL